jgi:hypothetical protein
LIQSLSSPESATSFNMRRSWAPVGTEVAIHVGW